MESNWNGSGMAVGMFEGLSVTCVMAKSVGSPDGTELLIETDFIANGSMSLTCSLPPGRDEDRQE